MPKPYQIPLPTEIFRLKNIQAEEKVRNIERRQKIKIFKPDLVPTMQLFR